MDMDYLSPTRVQIRYDLPLGGSCSTSSTRAQVLDPGPPRSDYEPIGLRPSTLVKVDMLLATATGSDALDHHPQRIRLQPGVGLVARLRKTDPPRQQNRHPGPGRDRGEHPSPAKTVIWSARTSPEVLRR